jgi:hypothetical protein
MLQGFSSKQISNCVTYPFGSLIASQRYFFLLLFSGLFIADFRGLEQQEET